MGIGAILGKTIENKIILMYMYAKRIKLLPPECFLQVLAGSETGDSWSQRHSREQDFTRQGKGGGGGGCIQDLMG